MSDLNFYDLTYEGPVVQAILDTAQKLRTEGYIFMGAGTPSTVPGTPTERVWYLCGPGTYSNFGSSVTVPEGSVMVAQYASSWTTTVIEIGSAGGGTFASGEEVGDVSLFDALSDLYGKTDAQKALMLPNGKVLEELTKEVIQLDLSMYPEKVNCVGPVNWQNGKHKVIPVKEGDVLHVTSQAVGEDLGAYSAWLSQSYSGGVSSVPYVAGTTRFVTRDDIVTAPAGAAWLCITTVDVVGYTIINTVAKVTLLTNESIVKKIGDVNAVNIAEGLTHINGKYISTLGTVQNNVDYFYTEPVFIGGGTQLIVTYRGGLISVVSKVVGDTFSPIHTNVNSAAPEIITDKVYISDDGYYVFCSTKSSGISARPVLTVEDRIEALERESIGEKIDYSVRYVGKYIDSSLNIVTQSFQTPVYEITDYIQVKKGETIRVKTHGGQIYVIAEYDFENDAILRGLVFSDYTSAAVYGEYTYIADEDMLVVVCGIQNDDEPLTVTIGGDIIEKIDNLTQYHCGIYLYPFRAIVGKPLSIYKESVVSGLRPLYNYTVQTAFAQSDPIDDYSKYSIRVNPASAGTLPLTIIATDEFNNHISKKVNVECVTMPSEKLANVNSLDVFFLGDSMIGWNGNLIGGEWKRMLATEDSETHVDPVTKAIQLPTYDVCHNKLNLVGEQLGSVSGVRYCYVNRIQQILTGKRSTDYNPNIGDVKNPNINPFYNRNSSNPDTVDSEGWNRRVDFGWYFDNACGVGNYPKLFYVALGANDIYETWNWSFDGVKPTTELLLKVIKKIKSVCDERAGGDSGIKIKVFNHQTYPLYNMFGYEFPLLQQRLVWNALYDSYYEAITNSYYGVSEYTEFVDCASKFDWRVGYTMTDISTNVRYDGNQDVFIQQTCHMNNVGAYNYADCLIDDFLADSDFD